MAIEFQMPKLGLTMEAGTIVNWLVPDLAEVTAGQAVLVIETDKVETEVESAGTGRLVQIGQIGESYACGLQIGWFLSAGEAAPAVVAPLVPQVASTASTPAPVAGPGVVRRAADGRFAASPNARRVARRRGIDISLVAGTGPDGRVVSEDVERYVPATRPAAAAVATTAGSGGAATAAATQLARLLGIPLASVMTASPDGQVGREDVAEYARSLIAKALAAPASPVMPKGLSAMRRTIATRMHQSLQDMAQLTLTMDADMGMVIADRNRRKSEGEEIPGFTDYVIKAAALALRSHPYVNSQFTPGGIELLDDIHVGMAVAVSGGLLVPVIRDADSRDLADLSRESTRLADAARTGKLTLAEMEGGTFSVTALGMFGVDAFTPVINPPNSGILGVGRMRDDVSWQGDTPRKVTRLTLSLTWDHRVFDGAPAAEFARTITTMLQDAAVWVRA